MDMASLLCDEDTVRVQWSCREEKVGKRRRRICGSRGEGDGGGGGGGGDGGGGGGGGGVGGGGVVVDYNVSSDRVKGKDQIRLKSVFSS